MPLGSSPTAIILENEMKGFSESLVSIWDQWEIRALLVIGIFAQIILLYLGSRRKYKFYLLQFSGIDSLLWCLYLYKEWVAGFALGVIFNKLGKVHCNCKCHNDTESAPLMAFGAAFFLFLLGEPHNMTAYALEDNELWLRHMAGLVGQASTTAYIIVLSWDTSNPFSFLSIVMFIVGLIKYGERIWTLYSASIKHRSSSVDRLDFGENLALVGNNEHSNKQAVLRRFRFLFISLFTDVVLSNRHIERERQHFRGIGIQEAFDIVRTELSFAYDVFYTKALIRHSIWGFISRLTTHTAVLCMLYVSWSSRSPNTYSTPLNDSFTYALFLSFPSALETVSILNFWFSSVASRLVARESCLWRLVLLYIDRKEQMPLIIQYDFLVLCDNNNKRRPATRPCELDMCCNFRKANHCSNLTGLMEIIFNNLKRKSVTFTSSNKPNFRDHILEYDRSLGWASELEFQRCIVLWHVATGICYYSDGIIVEDDEVHTNYPRVSKNLSDYMFYLLLECRNMLPVGSGLVTLQDTCYEAINFFHSENVPLSNAGEAYRRLLQFPPQPAVRIDDQSMLPRACELAQDLLAHDRNQMWRFLAELWVEMLGFAAANCSGNSHAQQLRRGGELLSEVWLLQAHFGVLDQFMVTEIHQDNQLINTQNEALQGSGMQVSLNMTSVSEIEHVPSS